MSYPHSIFDSDAAVLILNAISWPVSLVMLFGDWFVSADRTAVTFYMSIMVMASAVVMNGVTAWVRWRNRNKHGS